MPNSTKVQVLRLKHIKFNVFFLSTYLHGDLGFRAKSRHHSPYLQRFLKEFDSHPFAPVSVLR